MSSLIALMMLAAGTAPPSEAQRVCAQEVGAQATAYRLAELPPEIRSDLTGPSPYLKSVVADYDSPLQETDVYSEKDHLPSVRFAQAMLVRDEWFVQVQTARLEGVLTMGYERSRDDGRYHFVGWHALRGPPCVTIKAMLAGVSTPLR